MSEDTKISRRRFLKVAGAAVGASALACGGLVVAGTRRPKTNFAETACGTEETGNRILIAYASKCGSTGEVAEAVGEVLCNNGATVDVQQIKNVTDVSAYQAVVVGSAIRAGMWLSEATKFLETNKAALGQVPIAFFTVCMTLSEDTEENRREVMGYIDPVREILEPSSIGLFAGKMDYSKLSFLERTIIKSMKVPEGDFRNWEAIHTWTDELQPILLNA